MWCLASIRTNVRVHIQNFQNFHETTKLNELNGISHGNTKQNKTYWQWAQLTKFAVSWKGQTMKPFKRNPWLLSPCCSELVTANRSTEVILEVDQWSPHPFLSMCPHFGGGLFCLTPELQSFSGVPKGGCVCETDTVLGMALHECTSY